MLIYDNVPMNIKDFVNNPLKDGSYVAYIANKNDEGKACAAFLNHGYVVKSESPHGTVMIQPYGEAKAIKRQLKNVVRLS